MNHASEIQQKRITMPICDKSVSFEISNDYTLPDYHPEIRRILYVAPTVLPPSKYVSSAGAEYSGVVDYTVVYVGMDNKLYSAPLSAEYTFSVPINVSSGLDFNEGISSCADILSESVSTRLLGPRKVNIRTKLKAHARAYAAMMLDEEINEEMSSEGVQTLSEEDTLCEFTRITSDVLELSEEIIPESPQCRVISAQGKVFVSDVSNADGSANVRGEIYLTLLTEDPESGSVTQIQRKIPFSQVIEEEGLSRASRCMANGYISDISIGNEEGAIICDVSLIVELEAQSERKFAYLKDAYSTERASSAEYKSYSVPTGGYCLNGNFSMNEKLSKENVGFPQNATIVDCFATAGVEKLFTDGLKNVISGQAKYTVVILNEGEYSSFEALLPFKYEFENAVGSLVKSCEAGVNVVSCRVRQDAEELSIDAELSISAWGCGSTDINTICELHLENEVNFEKGSVIIYYPSTEDSLWSIAKRYFVPVSRIKTLNGISEDSINREYLII